MADHHEVTRLAARSRQVMATLGARAAQLNARLDAIEHRGSTVMDGKSSVLDSVERDIAQLENFVNQLSNNPPLDISPGDSLGTPDTNGVRLTQKAGA